jgi:hypothetical protein
MSKRPNLSFRYNTFIELSDLNELIATLQIAYKETHNEKVFRAIKKLKSIKADFWRVEDTHRKEEINEMLDNLGLYPHTIRTWVTMYREEENA